MKPMFLLFLHLYENETLINNFIDNIKPDINNEGAAMLSFSWPRRPAADGTNEATYFWLLGSG